jgi:hypothetical protein
MIWFAASSGSVAGEPAFAFCTPPSTTCTFPETDAFAVPPESSRR